MAVIRILWFRGSLCWLAFLSRGQREGRRTDCPSGWLPAGGLAPLVPATLMEHPLQAPHPRPGIPEARRARPHVSPLLPTLPQGSELLRDPSLGAQFRVHLVKMVILTQLEVGAELGAQSPGNLFLQSLTSVHKIRWRRDRLPTPGFLGFPGNSAGKESTCNVGDLGLIPGLGRSPGAGKGHPLQYCGLESSMGCIVHGVAESQTRVSGLHFTSPVGAEQGGVLLLQWAHSRGLSSFSSGHTAGGCLPSPVGTQQEDVLLLQWAHSRGVFSFSSGHTAGGCFPALWSWPRAPALPRWASGSSSVPWDGSGVVMRTEAAAAVSALLGVQPLNMCSVTGLSGCSEDHSQHHRVAAERL